MTTEESAVSPADTASVAAVVAKDVEALCSADSGKSPLAAQPAGGQTSDEPVGKCAEPQTNGPTGHSNGAAESHGTRIEPADQSGAAPEAEAKAMRLKDEANELFKQAQYEPAIRLYSQAIELHPTEHTFYSNRSIAYFRTECYGYAVADASRCIELNRNFLKGYYRRAVTYMAMAKFKEALRDFDVLVKVKPNDKVYKEKHAECGRIVRKIAFEKAISGDDNRSVADLIDLSAMTIEDDYAGPKLVDGKVTVQFMRDLLEHFREQKLLHRKHAYEIILQAQQLFKKLHSLVDIHVPDGNKFTVCGDIHGQYYDLLNIFKLNGLPSEENPYLFNGDFVDRGSFSLECILTLFAFKVLYPEHFFLTRGNHESHSMNQIYGFAEEVKCKYSNQMYELFAEVFNQLPLCYCLNKRVLVMHGGLFSEDDVTLDAIRKVDRFRQPPNDGIMCELLWSDPMEAHGRAPSQRGVGVRFGPDVTRAFCERNRLDYVIRSHEAMQNGFEKMHENRCITVFSAPNYCDTMKNKGAFITMRGPLLAPEITSYSEVPHPKVRSYMNNSLMYF